MIADAVTAVLAAGSCIAALHGSDFGVVLDGELAVVVDAVAGAAAVGGAAGSVIDAGLPGDGERTGADAVAGVTAAVAAVAVAAGGADNVGFAGDGEVAVAVDATAAVVGAMALAALGFLDGAARNRDGSRIVPVTAAAADAVAVGATHGLHNGAAGDDDIGVGAASSLCAAADAGTTVVIIAPRLAYGADGGDVAACYLNGAGTFAPGAADASSATVACGSQAAGVFAILLFGCDGQFAGANGTAAIIALFIVLEAGALVAAGQLVVAHERDFGVARTLDAEGGVVGLATAGIDVDIVQRHVEGVVFSGAFIAHELVDDADDVLGRGLEVFRRSLQGRGRFVRGPFVVIGAGVRELAFQHGAAALRAFGKGPAAGGVARAFTLRVRTSRTGVLAVGGAAGLGGGVSLAAGGGAAGLGLFFLVAGGAAGLGVVFLAAGGGSVVRFGVAAPRAGGAAVRAFTLRVRASRTGVLAVGGVTGLGLFRGLVLVFLAAAVRRVAALGVAGVDHVFVFVFAVV